TPFQGWGLAVAPKPRALPWAAIFEPFGLADLRIPTTGSNSKTPPERSLALEWRAYWFAEEDPAHLARKRILNRLTAQ
ncbi:MAG: hypothetical protein ABIP48_13510, partial [Planctomycetota bacterium]